MLKTRTLYSHILYCLICTALLFAVGSFDIAYAAELTAKSSISLSDDTVVGSISFTNSTGTVQYSDAVLAFYSEHEPEKVHIEHFRIPANAQNHTETIRLNPSSDTASVKLMVWGKIPDIAPLCDAVSADMNTLRANLTWAPPKLINPVVLTVGVNDMVPKLDDSRDYVIRLPDTSRETILRIQGGRNVAVFGGHIKIPDRNASEWNSSRRAIYILDGAQGRTVHIEGVLVTCHDDNEGDAIAINAPNTIVQVENFRIENLQGAIDTEAGHTHADIIQPWGGVKELRVDRLTGSSNYQGLFLKSDYTDNGDMILKNIDLTANEKWFEGAGGGYVLWLDTFSAGAHTYLENVYVRPRKGVGLSQAIWPTINDADVPSRPEITESYAWWPNLSCVSGKVYLADSATAEFVPSGSVGIGYEHKWGTLY